MNVLVRVKIRVRARDYSGGISASCFFSIQYTFVVDFVFLFACQKYILMLIVTSL